MHKLIATFLSALLLTGVAVAGDTPCLSVARTDWAPARSAAGTMTVEWSARLDNRCTAAYDATLAILFTDADGDVLHRAMTVVAVPPDGTKRTEKDLYLPENRFPEVEQVEIDITEQRVPH